jgi:hypothetical protein
MKNRNALAFFTSILLTLLLFASAHALDGMVLLNTGSSREAAGDLIVHYLPGNERVTLEQGGVRGANFSPDASQVAFGKGGTLYVMNIDGSGKRAVTSCGTGFQSCTWVAEGYIYWGQNDKQLHRVKPDGSGKGTVLSFEQNVQWPSMSANGKHAAWWSQFGTSPVAICYDMTTSSWWNKSGGCRCTVSPDGSMVTKNRSGHRQSYIYKFEGKGHNDAWVILLINNPTYDGSPYCNMQRFSSLSNDHIVYTNERKFVCYVHNIRTNTPTLVGSGIASDFAPFVVGDKLPAPAIAPEGATFTDAVEVTMSHSLNGAVIRYTLDGSEPTETSTAYSAAISVTSTTTVKAKAFADGKESFVAVQSYTKVSQVSTLTEITVDPASAVVMPGLTQQFAAAAKDQFGNEMDVTIAWSVSGGGTISTKGLFTAGNTEGGPYTVTASVAGKSVKGTAEATVAQAALEIISPKTDDVYAIGETLTVAWQWTGPNEYSGSVDVEISADGGLSWYSIAPGGNSVGPQSAEWGSLEWTVGMLDDGNVSPVSSLVMARVADYNDPDMPGKSALSSTFAIKGEPGMISHEVFGAGNSTTWSMERMGGKLSFDIAEHGVHRLIVSDLMGRAVRAWAGQAPAAYSCVLPAGAYIVRLNADGRIDTRRVILERCR